MTKALFGARRRRPLACGSTIVGMLCLVGGAEAQDAGQAVGAAASIPADPPVAAAPNSGQIGDIIVTAQRRSENAQKVPIAITAADTETLQRLGVTSSTDLQLISPSVTVRQGSSGMGVVIRGISGTGSGADEVVAGTYIDGVYLPSAASSVVKLVDIERIEVLKGPQGTLFGRNNSSGAISIITRMPDATTRGELTAGYGNYNRWETTGYLSGPIATNLFASVTAYFANQSDGWGRNVVTGNKAFYGFDNILRAKLRWAPSSATDIYLSGFYVRQRSPYVEGRGVLAGQLSLAGDPYPGDYNVTQEIDQDRIISERNLALHVSQDLGPLRVVAISSYDRVNQLPAQFDNDASRRLVVEQFFAGNRGQYNQTFSQELQFLSPDSFPIKLTGGLYYFRNHLGFDRLVSVRPTGASVTIANQNTVSYAAFSQATVPVTRTTKVTVGLRYTIDTRDALSRVDSIATPAQHSNDKKLTWRFAVDQQFTPAVLGYASGSRGFKSGFFNVGSFQPFVRPQTVDTYEVGLKSDLFNRHLRINAAAFYNDFDNIQVRAINPVDGAALTFNAAKAHTYGFEADLTARPVGGLTLTGGLTLLRGTYTDFPNAPFFTLKPAGGAIQAIGNATGRDTIATPHTVFTVAASYETGPMRFNASVEHNGGYWFDPQNRLRQPAYDLLNSEIRYTHPSGFSVRVWARNLLDKFYFNQLDPSTSGDLYWPAEPRTYGATVGFRF